MSAIPRPPAGGLRILGALVLTAFGCSQGGDAQTPPSSPTPSTPSTNPPPISPPPTPNPPTPNPPGTMPPGTMPPGTEPPGTEPPPAMPPPSGMFSHPEMVKVPTFPDRKCPVNGGAGTAEINAAIAMCSMMGGGVVTFAPGNYNTASIHMQSNVKLDLNGATLHGTGTDGAEGDPSPVVCSDDGHRHWHNAMIWGQNVTNVAVVNGTLNGGGLDTNSQKMIAFKDSSVMQFEGLNQSNTGHFGYLLTNCHDITMAKVTVHPSRDGVDLMQCSNVNAHDLSVTGGGDDAFALKSDCTSGKAVVTDNVTVGNSTFGSGDNALQFGSETWGDFSNISWFNIKVIKGGKSGIGIQMNDGGVVKNVSYDNITLEGTSFPIFISATSLLRATTKMAGHAENIRFNNITATNINAGNNKSAQETAIIVSGQPSNPHSGIVFQHVKINFPGGGSPSGDPPEGTSLKGGVSYNPRFITPIPAYGLFTRHVKGLELHDVKFTFGANDQRPALIARDVDGLVLDTFSAQKGGGPLLELDTIKNLNVTASAPLPDGMMSAVGKMTF